MSATLICGYVFRIDLKTDELEFNVFGNSFYLYADKEFVFNDVQHWNTIYGNV